MPVHDLRVLFAASEMTPYAKSGGLGDVMGSLPDALSRMGVECHVIMPLYRLSREAAAAAVDTGQRININLGSDEVSAGLHTLVRDSGVTVWFLDIPAFYDRDGLYGENNHLYGDAAARYVALSKAAIQLAQQLRPDILHVNDWFTALAAVFLKEHAHPQGVLTGTSSVLTIHNLAYQGIFWYYDWHLLDLPDNLFHHELLEFFGHINFLKGGIVYADAVTTVSSGYAEEILRPEFGNGLEGVLEAQAHKLVGIVNGIDTHVWSPETDALLPVNYSADAPDEKKHLRALLLQRAGLQANGATAVIGLIGRMVDQKGWPVLQAAIAQLLQTDAVFVVLGSGDPAIETWIQEQAVWFPDKLSVTIGYDEAYSHLIEAGSDFFLMPSLFEPCGLNQMYSMRYGTLPIAHATGGLKDTITDLDKDPGAGTGFLFYDYSADAMMSAVYRALEFRVRSPQAFAEARQRGMREDFSWERSAARYLNLYRNVIADKRR